MVPASNSTATTAMVLSLVGLVVGLFTGLGFLIGIGGIVMGNRARREIRASGGVQGGDGAATAGIVIGWIDVGLFVVGLLVLLFAIGAIITFFGTHAGSSGGLSQ
jgi:hypothetical protein